MKCRSVPAQNTVCVCVCELKRMFTGVLKCGTVSLRSLQIDTVNMDRRPIHEITGHLDL